MKEAVASEPAVSSAASALQHSSQQTDVLPAEASAGLFFQTKLSVGAPDDPLEREADAVADKVMRMPENSFVQRKCAHCEGEEKIHKKEITPADQKVQRDEATEETPESVPPAPLPFHLLRPEELQLRPPMLPPVRLFPAGGLSLGTPPYTLPDSASGSSTTGQIDWFAMNRPFSNRGVGQLTSSDARAIEAHWNYSFDFFRSIGATAGHATFFSNMLVPMAIDTSLQRDYSTWWERTDRELGTSSKIFSPTIIRFDLDNLFGTIRPFWDPSNPYLIQRKSEANAGVASESTSNLISASKSGGSPMPDQTKTFMESRFGYDFSNVRIHSGNDAATMSRDLNAKAFTVSNHIYFNQGNFSPDTSEGKQLLAHELTHTLQQGGSAVRKKTVSAGAPEKSPNRNHSFIQCKLRAEPNATLPESNNVAETEIRPKKRNETANFQSRLAATTPPDDPAISATVTQSIQAKADATTNSSGEVALYNSGITDVRISRNPEYTFIQKKCAACEHDEKIQRKALPGNFLNAVSKPIVEQDENEPVKTPSSTRKIIQRNIIGAAWNATGGRAVSAIGSAASTVYDAAGNAVSSAVEWVEDQAESIINRIAPGLIDFLRGDIIQNIKDGLASALDAATGGLFSRLQAEGLQGVLEEFISSIVETINGTVERGCDAFAILARKVLDFIRALGGAALQRIIAFFRRVGGLLSSFWNNFALPIWDAIKSFAGTVWDWMTRTAAWLWDLIAPIRNAVARAWNWLMRQFGIAWRAGGSVLDWLKNKAQQAWNWLMGVIEPIKTPLMIIGGVLLLLSPLGPIVAIGAGAYAIYRGVQWVRENWNSEVFVRFRHYLKEHVFDVISGAIESLKNSVVGAFSWLANTLLSLQTPIVRLLESLGALTLFRFIQTGIQNFANHVTRAVNWAGERLADIGHHIINVARDVWEFIRPYAIIITKLTVLVLNPWLLPPVLAAWAWRILPDCFKPPIIDFVIGIMISVLRSMPNFKMFGDSWPQIKQQIIQFLQNQLVAEQEEKIVASNRIARMVSELDLELISNQIEAARQMPGHFEGQMEEELLGSDLTVALPFERIEEPTLTQQVSSSGAENEFSAEDMALLQKSTYSENDIGVDQVGQFEPEPELVHSLLQRTGTNSAGVIEFGNSTDSTRTVHSILGGMMPSGDAGLSTQGGPQTPGLDANAQAEANDSVPVVPGPPLSREQETEQRLQEMLNQSEQNMMSQACSASQQHAVGSEAATPFPESAKFGPLTRNQRARYTMSQMWTGLRRWFGCNRNWLIPSIIGAIVLLVVAEVLSGGVVTAALPVIMEVVTSIMIGVAVVRGAYYLGEYVYKSIGGDIAGAAKSLARSIAVAAVEAIFALLGSDAFWKSLKSGAASVGRVIARAGRAIGRFSPMLGRAGRAILSSVHAIVERGRLVMRGVGERVGRGVRTVDEFAERLLTRLRFRRFRIRFEHGWFRLEGYINPWVLLATGRVVEVDEAAIQALQTGANKTVLGRSIRVAGVEGVVIGAEKNASRLTEFLQGGERTLGANAALYEQVASRGLTGSAQIYGAAVENIIQTSSSVQAMIRRGVPASRLENVILNSLRFTGADVSSILSRLQRIQRFNLSTFDRLLSEFSHTGEQFARNKFIGAEWTLEFLSRQSPTFLAGIEGFEIVSVGRRMDIVINGIGYEFKNWGDLSNISGLVRQMSVDFQVGTGLSRYRYIISPRAGETSSIIAAITARLADHFTPQQINIIITQLESIIIR